MNSVKTVMGWISVIISIVIVIFYLEGFIFYSFKGNLGFLFSFFIAPLGVVLGYISQNEHGLIKIFGLYGNIAVMLFSFLYWSVGYIIEFFLIKVM